MDFVIFGVGLGATLVLFGWLWRTVGPQLRHRTARDAVLSGEAMVERISWRRFCRSGGALWIMGGFLLVLAAYVSLLLNLSDHTGALVVLFTALAVFVVIALWLVVYLQRFGLTGLVPKREPAIAPQGRARSGGATQKLPSEAPGTPAFGPPLPIHGPPSPTHGPAMPAGIAASHAPTQGPAAADAAAETGEHEAPDIEPAHDVAPTEEAVPADAPHQPEPDATAHNARIDGNDSNSEEAPTVIGADVRKDQAATSPGDEQPQLPKSVSEHVREEARASEPPVADALPTNGRSLTATESEPRRVGTESFRAAIARQKANLDRAATRDRSVIAGQDASPATQADPSSREPAGVEGKDWMRGDGTRSVPPGFPIKGNARSRRYHPAGAPTYEATIAEFYFATPDAAEAAGYQLPRALQESGGGHVAGEPDHHP